MLRARRAQLPWTRRRACFEWWATAAIDCTRTQNVEPAARALGSPLLGGRAIPTRVRTNVAKSTVHNRLLHQAGQWTSLSKAWRRPPRARYMAPLRRILRQYKPPEPGTHRMRDDEVLRMLKVPRMEAQLAVDRLRLASQIETSQQALALVVSSAGAEWREELTQAMQLVAEVLKDKLASLPRPRESLHTWEDFWNKWPGQWAALLKRRSTSGSSERRRRARSTRQNVSIRSKYGCVHGVASFFLDPE